MQALGVDCTMAEAIRTVAYDPRLYAAFIYKKSVAKGGRAAGIGYDYRALNEKARDHPAAQAFRDWLTQAFPDEVTTMIHSDGTINQDIFNTKYDCFFPSFCKTMFLYL
jgi:hypothetical protein